MPRTLVVMSKKDQRMRRRKKEKRARSNAKKRRALGSAVEHSACSVDDSSPCRRTENRRFNRAESSTEHYYYEEYGTNGVGDAEYDGWIKCRLLHGHGYSLIVPDQLYLEQNELRWIQPLAFGPCMLVKLGGTEVVCDLSVDV